MIQLKGTDAVFRNANSIMIAKRSISYVYIGMKLIWTNVLWLNNDIWDNNEEW